MKYVLFLLMLLLAACGSNSVTKNAPATSQQQIQSAPPAQSAYVLTTDDRELIQLKQSWQSYARKVADQSHDDEAEMIMNMVINNLLGVASMPDGMHSRVLETAARTCRLRFSFRCGLSIRPAKRWVR